MFERALEHLETGLELLRQLDLDTIRPTEMGERIKAIHGVSDRLQAEGVRWLEAFDRGRGFGPSGDTSTTSWLRNNCHLSGFTADRQVKLARQLPELESTSKALAAGEIGIEHALEIARATQDLGPAAEGELLSVAKEKDPAEVRLAARDLRHRLDADGMARLAAEQYRKRRLRIYGLPDGMVGLEGALPPEGGALLRLTLDRVSGPPAADDHRSPEQRNADAMLDLCQKPGQARAQLTVIVREETLAGEPDAPAARLEDGTPLSAQTARRLACEGSVTLLRVDHNGNPLEMGRARRLATRRQKKAMLARDGGCVFPACDRTADWCESHHLDHWVLGGKTNVDRMVLLCRRHHMLVHEGGWRLVQEDGQILAQPSAGRGP